MNEFYRYFVKGVVQGVGFRPYIYRKALEHGLKGYVKNTGNGVEIVVNEADFMSCLDDLPPLAHIAGFSFEAYTGNQTFDHFSISQSTVSSEGETELPPDIFMCDDCLRELREHGNRREGYYFITCTNCGPRFSMIDDYPYDRPLTAMKKFEMCPACKAEYTDPADRRYHAQTIACKDCGPRLRLLKGTKDIDITSSNDVDTIRKAAQLIKDGEVVAIKGVGGFHLCSLADDEHVAKIRKILGRPDKPFALLVKDIESVKKMAEMSPVEEKLLLSPQRPIVVLQKKRKDDFHGVSELGSIGIMLPYTALHYILFDFIDTPLVFTSCNIPGEPVATTEQLGEYFLTHEREIVNRCDDSVIKVINDHPFFLRRSRGYVPLPISLPMHTKDTIALGAEMNSVMCTTKSDKCYLSQYIGETSKFETFNFLREATEKMMMLTRARPRMIACDLHPSYNSTTLAKELSSRFNAGLVQVQHHKAHVASVAAEHGITDYVGIAMDGLGYGEDGNIWGGEIFDVRNGTEFRRAGHIELQPQLGGDSATMHPKKMLFGILSKILDEKELLSLELFDKKDAELYLRLLKEKEHLVYATSAGRVLDAIAALLELCDARTYDGRPAMLLESVALENSAGPDIMPAWHPVIKEENGMKILSTTTLFKFLLENLHLGKSELAYIAHRYLAAGMFAIAREVAEGTIKKDGKKIVFSGGVAYNRIISSYMMENGVLMNVNVPPGDGGVCYGQAYLAGLMEQNMSHNGNVD